MSTTTQSGIPLQFYPLRIDNDALLRLADLAQDCIVDRAPLFGGWLIDFAHSEYMRRLAGMADDVRDVELPRIPVTQWSDKDIGQALTAVVILSHSVRDQTAGEFIDNLVWFITTAAARRLTKG